MNKINNSVNEDWMRILYKNDKEQIDSFFKSKMTESDFFVFSKMTKHNLINLRSYILEIKDLIDNFNFQVRPLIDSIKQKDNSIQDVIFSLNNPNVLTIIYNESPNISVSKFAPDDYITEPIYTTKNPIQRSKQRNLYKERKELLKRFYFELDSIVRLGNEVFSNFDNKRNYSVSNLFSFNFSTDGSVNIYVLDNLLYYKIDNDDLNFVDVKGRLSKTDSELLDRIEIQKSSGR